MEDIIKEGINQAIKASHIVKDLNIDLIICSPMKRTKHTMELVNINNIKVIYDDRLYNFILRKCQKMGCC